MSESNLVETEKNGPSTRPLRKRLRTALQILVSTGCTQKEAAAQAGMSENGLSLALQRVPVKEELARISRLRLELETARSWHRVFDLRDNAASEEVKLKATRTHLEAVGELSDAGSGRNAGNSAPLIQVIVNPAYASIQPGPERLPGVVERPAIDITPREVEHRPQIETHPLIQVGRS